MVFRQGSVKLELTHQILFEFKEVVDYVNMSLDMMMAKTVSSIKDLHYFSLVFSCIIYSVLMVH